MDDEEDPTDRLPLIRPPLHQKKVTDKNGKSKSSGSKRGIGYAVARSRVLLEKGSHDGRDDKDSGQSGGDINKGRYRSASTDDKDGENEVEVEAESASDDHAHNTHMRIRISTSPTHESSSSGKIK